MPKSELVDLKMALHFTTPSAVQVSLTGEKKDAVWLPLSQIEMEKGRNGLMGITLPVRLATEKGLV